MPGRDPHNTSQSLPAELEAALASEPRAYALFAALPDDHRREYVQWVAYPRQMQSRERRAAQTVMRLLERADG